MPTKPKTRIGLDSQGSQLSAPLRRTFFSGFLLFFFSSKISERSVCVSTTSLELFGLMAGGTVMALNMQDEVEAQVYTASQEETGHLAGKTGDEEQNVVLATGEIRSAKCAG
jgi:hypothetical protein